MPEKGTEFLSVYIQMLIKYSGGYGFESLRSIWKQESMTEMEKLKNEA